jgi:hypothetical protein
MTEIRYGGASPDAPPVVHEVNYEQPENGEVEGSLISKLRGAAKAQQETHYKDLKVGGEFRDNLWIRYQTLGDAQMDRFINRRAQLRQIQELDPKKDLPFTELNMDLMAHACSAVVGKSDGEEVILEDSDGPLRLEHRLAVFLELPVPGEFTLPARDVITLIFGGNALAIIDHGDDLMEWLRDPVEQQSAGES